MCVVCAPECVSSQIRFLAHLDLSGVSLVDSLDELINVRPCVLGLAPDTRHSMACELISVPPCVLGLAPDTRHSIVCRHL